MPVGVSPLLGRGDSHDHLALERNKKKKDDASLAVGSISADLSCSVFPPFGEERGLIPRTAAGNRVYISRRSRAVVKCSFLKGRGEGMSFTIEGQVVQKPINTNQN